VIEYEGIFYPELEDALTTYGVILAGLQQKQPIIFGIVVDSKAG